MGFKEAYGRQLSTSSSSSDGYKRKKIEPKLVMNSDSKMRESTLPPLLYSKVNP